MQELDKIFYNFPNIIKYNYFPLQLVPTLK